VRSAFHEDRFGAQAHELRGRTGWQAHEARAVTHERLHRASPASAHVEATPVWPVQRAPKSQPRHAQASATHRLPAYQAAAEPARHAARADHQRPAHDAARRTHQQAHHSRGYIHARHLARVRYRQELSEYHLELRQWRHRLVERERLLRKLASLERRLARQAVLRGRRMVAETYEIDGTWFHQIGRRRPVALKKRPS